jgi:hypothetical protein
MNSASQDNAVIPETAGAQSEAKPQTRPRPKNTRTPLPEDYKQLCALCRAGKLFAVQEWFKTHKYEEPEHYTCKHWPIGIAIEKGFHSLAEVLLQNGVPADGGALQRAAEYRNIDFVELILQFGATVDMVDFEYIVFIGEREIIRKFIDCGADLVTGYPIAKGLIRLTRLFLGIYKSNIEKHPDLQFQADMALRHFCGKANLRGVSLLMWLGANPRAKVPCDADESEECWETPLEAAVSKGQLDIIKRLKPDATKDDVNALLDRSLSHKNMDLVRYWVSLGADINRPNAEGYTAHRHVMWSLEWALDPKSFWFGREGTETKRFANEWFSSGAKWQPQDSDFKAIRKALSRLSYMEAYEFIKLLLAKEVMSAEALGEILDTPKLREHLKERREAIAALVPKVEKWVKAEERKRQLEQQRQAATRRSSRQNSLPPPPVPERRVIWNDPRYVRRLSDE